MKIPKILSLGLALAFSAATLKSAPLEHHGRRQKARIRQGAKGSQLSKDEAKDDPKGGKKAGSKKIYELKHNDDKR